MLLIACGDERSHFERQETTLVVSAPATARLRLFHAGDDLEEATELDFPATRRKWLSKGRYFLQVDEGGQTLYYPVVVLGFRAGPDRDGTLAITVRPAPTSHLPDFADVPSGYVLLGDSANPQEQHYVWVSAYAMSVFEVTNAQFREFLFDPSGFAKPENWTKQGRDWIASNHSTASALMSPSAPDFGRFGQPEQPVTGVTWFEANAFCRWSYRASGGREVALHASQRRGVGKGRSRPGRFRLRPRNVDQRQADWLVQLNEKPLAFPSLWWTGRRAAARTSRTVMAFITCPAMWPNGPSPSFAPIAGVSHLPTMIETMTIPRSAGLCAAVRGIAPRPRLFTCRTATASNRTTAPTMSGSG